MLNPVPAVSAIVVENKSILMVKRKCEPNKGLWSLPGGRIELGETAEHALIREVFEETSLKVQIDRVAAVHDIIIRNNAEVKYHYVIINYIASVISGVLKHSSDASEARWVPFSEVKNLKTTPGLLEHLSNIGII